MNKSNTKPILKLSAGTQRILVTGIFTLVAAIVSGIISILLPSLNTDPNLTPKSPVEIASEIKISLDRVNDLVTAVENLAASAKEKDEELARLNRELEILRAMNEWSEETRKEFYRMMNPPIWQDWLFRFIQVLLGAVMGLFAKVWWDKREANRATEPKSADANTS